MRTRDPREIVLLGSTGSIGTQAIDIVRAQPRPVPGGRDRRRRRQRGACSPRRRWSWASTWSAWPRPRPRRTCSSPSTPRRRGAGYATGEFRIPKILAGPQAMTELAEWPCDVVLNGVVGSLGPGADAGRAAGRPDAGAGQQGVAGRRRPAGPGAWPRPGQIVPVDSEHSALAQCLRSGTAAEVRRLILTASGGPFRGRGPRRAGRGHAGAGAGPPDLEHGPGRHDQLGHAGQQGPGGDRGARAVRRRVRRHRGHGAPAVGDPLDGRVHRRLDARPGSPPDMRLPIALALGWPDRVPGAAAAVDWTAAHTWELRAAGRRGVPGGARWPRRPAGPGAAGRRSTTRPTRSVWPVSPQGRLPFLGIVDTVARVLDEAPDFAEPGTVEDVLAAESWARTRARELIAAAVDAATSGPEGSLMADRSGSSSSRWAS